MLFTFHAKDRFAERFPDCPLSLEQAFDQSIPFGAETKSTINRIHPHYKIVFVVDKNNGDYYVKTVLTEDLYTATFKCWPEGIHATPARFTDHQ